MAGKRTAKTTEDKVLLELKEINKLLNKIFVSVDDTRKYVDNIQNERRP